MRNNSCYQSIKGSDENRTETPLGYGGRRDRCKLIRASGAQRLQDVDKHSIGELLINSSQFLQKLIYN